MSKQLKKSVDNLYKKVDQIIESSRNVVYAQMNATVVTSYWQIGKLIVEEEQKGEQKASYGQELVGQLSERLSTDNKGFSKRNLWYMRNFYLQWPKVNALRSLLSWTHYRILLKVKDERARQYYMNAAADQKWSTRVLERQIGTQFYERLLTSSSEEESTTQIENKELQSSSPKEIIKDPYVLEFLNIPASHKIQERDLENALINQLQEFMLELGKGFSFVRRQYRVNSEMNDYYVDLVFYNYILKCFVLIDLKTTTLSHGDIGQMDFYVRFFEDQIRQTEDNPTIGLILCAEKDNTIAKYSLLSESKQIFASKYKTYLPTEEELKKEIERGRHQIEIEKELKE